MYALERPPPFLRRLSSHASAMHDNTLPPSRLSSPTLTITTNSLRQRPVPKSRPAPYHLQPRLPPGTLKKAAPTVSLTNASAVRTATCHSLPSMHSLFETPPTQSFIPFPTSAPIDCPPPHSSSDPGAEDARSSVEHQACTPSPFDVPSKPDSANVPIGNIEQRKRRLRSFLNSSSSPSPSNILPYKRPKIPSAKGTSRARKSRKQVADLQFTALMHRSIVWQLNAVRVSAMDVDSGVESQFGNQLSPGLLDQDTILAERLWKSLMDQGLQPVLSRGTGKP